MKRFVTLLIGLSILVGIAVSAHAEEFTNSDLAYVVVNMLGIEVDTTALSADEAYEVMANAIAATGIDYFTTTAAAGTMNCGEFSEILYALLRTGDDPDLAAKIQYLEDNGYLTCDSIDQTVDRDQALAALNNPGFATAVAEAYSPPVAGGAGDPAIGSADVSPEEPASQIF